MNYPDDYRFGFDLDAMKAELEDHQPIFRMGCYIPTAREVLTMHPKDLEITLELWMWESPTMLIPNNEQIAEVITVIQSRHDVDRCNDVLNNCFRYIGVDTKT